MKTPAFTFGSMVCGSLVFGLTTAEVRAQGVDQAYVPFTTGNTIIAARYNAAQTFTVGRSGLLTQVEVPVGQMYDVYSLPLTLDIRAVTAAGVPTEADAGSTVLTSVTLAAAAIPPSDGRAYQWVMFDVPDIAVTSGEVLALTMRTQAGAQFPGPDDVPFVWNADSSGGYADGRAFVRGTSAAALTWSAEGNWDYGFRTFVVPVPEPSATLLLVLGGLVFTRSRRPRSPWHRVGSQ